MKTKLSKFWYTFFIAAAVAVPQAEATPGFARQVNTDCMSCHYQNIPKLNAFGRSFKLSGFTMDSGDSLKKILSDSAGKLSLPSNLNLAFVTKARLLQPKDGVMSTEIFDESALLFGGRVSENIGTSMEFTEGLVGGKFIYSQEALAGRVGLAYSMTDALGAFAATEIYSTGLYRPVRQFENRKGANIFQKTGIGAGAATGMSLYYSGSGIYATLGAYVPAFGSSIDTAENFKTMARLAYETSFGVHEVSLGAYYLGGDVSVGLNDINASSTISDLALLDQESYGIDLQTQGSIGSNMSLMVTFAYVISNKADSGAVDESGFSLATQVNLNSRLGIKLAYLNYNDNITAANSENDLSIGAEYNVDQNVRMVLEYTDITNNDKSKDGLLLFMSMIAF